MKIRINSIIPKTDVEGPGTRFCIWTQGCSIRCEGCANYELWDFSGGKLYSVYDILEMILSVKDEIEGITFLGGEPLEQIDAVSYISKEVNRIGLSVLLFTGYKYENLKKNPKFLELIKNIDILIDGKYERDNQDFSRAWVGSSNQNYYFLSDRYDKSILKKYKNKIELRIDDENKVSVNGMGDFERILSLIN